MLGNYSDDEMFALIVGIIVGAGSWIKWYHGLAVVGNSVRPHGGRWSLAITPVLCAFLLYFVLNRWSAEDVRTDPAYMLFYMVVGGAWLGLVTVQLPLFGLSMRDDVIERGNNAAGHACAGALLGGACCFAGANVGNGPGWWVVLFSAFLSTASLLSLWWLLHRCSGVSEKVTIDRDLDAGLRAAGFFIGAGIILGRAVAGDWLSAGETTVEFGRMAWPALLLTGMVIAVERSCRPNFAASSFASGLTGWLPGFVYIVTGLVVMFAWST